MPPDHEPGKCFCGDCRARARLNAPALYAFVGRQPGEPRAFAQAFAWCPWCARWHRHGDQTSEAGDVLHRLPHCATRHSPYRATGYYVVVTNTPLTAVYRRVKRATADQRQVIDDGRTTPAIERLRAQVLPVLRPDHNGGWSS